MMITETVMLHQVALMNGSFDVGDHHVSVVPSLNI